MSCRRLLSLALLLALAGCGSDSAASRPAATPSPTATAGDDMPKPCAAEVARMLGARTSIKDASHGIATCVYKAPHLQINVQVDVNPQVPFRFERAVVERGQNAVWGHNKTKAPVQLHGIGIGADWFPADRDLLTTDNKQLVDVILIKGGSLKLSRSIARATLTRK